MRFFLPCFFLLLTTATLAQSGQEAEVQSTIDAFFTGFHARDTVQMKSVLSETAGLQSIGRNPEGETVVRTERMSDFLKSIASIPDTVAIEERLLNYRVQVDGPMAHAWTPYEFYLQGEFHHCGVNSFQLIHQNGKWTILSIMDTRRREGCR